MTVRELLEVISFDKEIFIKPNGNRMYFDGSTSDVPESLMEAKIIEIVPQIYKADPDKNHKFYWGLGIWVESIKEFDVMCDCIEDFKEFTAKEIDGTYGYFIASEGRIMDEFLQDREKKKKERLSYLMNDSQKYYFERRDLKLDISEETKEYIKNLQTKKELEQTEESVKIEV